MGDTGQRLAEIVAEQLKISEARVLPETTFADLGMDSLDKSSLVMELEDEFDIQFPDNIEGTVKTMQDLVDLIEKLDGERQL